MRRGDAQVVAVVAPVLDTDTVVAWTALDPVPDVEGGFQDLAVGSVWAVEGAGILKTAMPPTREVVAGQLRHVTQEVAAAASTIWLRSPPGVGTTMISSGTPATFAGIAFISTEEG